ncbi:FANCI solenoid 4-domain-containing protein [Chytridium lagenaria]|nr:FANCI solenoid 4-domain-containing protein [Chytridium lagenaria]
MCSPHEDGTSKYIRTEGPDRLDYRAANNMYTSASLCFPNDLNDSITSEMISENLPIVFEEVFEEAIRTRCQPLKKSFEVFSKSIQVLSKLSVGDQIEDKLKRLCQNDWGANSIFIANAIIGISLSDSCIDAVLIKLLRSDGRNTLAASSEKIRIHGTVLSYICFALKQNNALQEEWTKWSKGIFYTSLKPFEISFLLACAENSSLILKSYKSQFFYCMNVKGLQLDLIFIKLWTGLPKTSHSLDKEFMMVTRACGQWDSVAANLIQLSFTLMDTGNAASTKKDESRFTATNAAALGAKILADLLSNQPNRRAVILEQILSRILQSGSTSPVLFSVFDKTLAMNMNAFSEHLNYFRKLSHICQLCSLKMDESEAIRNSLMLTCRKGIFSKSLEARKFSCIAFLGLLSLSEQPQECSSQGVYWPTSQDSQILSTLRKALSLQSEVRNLVYTGLNSVLQSQQWLAPAVLEIISPHFLQYYESESAIKSPVKLDLCVSRAGESYIVSEPLHFLLLCFADVSLMTSDPTKQYEDSLLSFAKRLSECDLPDFDLFGEKGLSESYDIQKSRIKGDLLLEIYEAATLFILMRVDNTSSDYIGLAEKLCGRKLTLSTKIKEAWKGKKMKKIVHHDILSVWNGKFAFSAFRFLLSKNLFSANVGEETLKWVFLGIEKTLSVPKSDLYAVYVDILRLLLRECFVKQGKAKSKVQKYIQSSMVESIRSIFSAISEYIPQQLLEIIGLLLLDLEMIDAESRSNKSLVFFKFYGMLKKIIHGFLSEDKTQKDALALIQTFEIVLKSLVFHTAANLEDSPFEHWEDMSQWLSDFCYVYEISDTGLAKHCTSSLMILLRWSWKLDKLVTFSKKLRIDLGTVMESVEEKEDIMAGLDMAIVPIWYSSTVSCIDDTFEIMSWLLTQKFSKTLTLKEMARNIIPKEKIFAQAQDFLCKKMTKLLQALTILQQCSLLAPQREQLLKTLVRAYKVMCSLAKQVTLEIKIPRSVDGVFLSLLEANEDLRGTMNQIVPLVHQMESTNAETLKKPAKRQRNGILFTKKKRIVTESKTMPALIFQIELFERFIISLNKKSKVNLLKYVKRSTARDFKIIETKMLLSSEDEEEEEMMK